jgi:hypothetical protein
MTRRDLFQQMGGLDTSFSPAYFEDVDYCVRLWRLGRRIVYLPAVTVRHYENASSSCSLAPFHLYRRNHLLFTQKHADWLSGKCPAATTSPLWARSSHDDRIKVLYLAADGSRPELAPCESALVAWLGARNCFVTVYPIGSSETPTIGQTQFPPDVEVLHGGSFDGLPRFLAERRGYYECILASDPALLEQVRRFAVLPAARPTGSPAAVSSPPRAVPAHA